MGNSNSHRSSSRPPLPAIIVGTTTSSTVTASSVNVYHQQNEPDPQSPSVQQQQQQQQQLYYHPMHGFGTLSHSIESSITTTTDTTDQSVPSSSSLSSSFANQSHRSHPQLNLIDHDTSTSTYYMNGMEIVDGKCSQTNYDHYERISDRSYSDDVHTASSFELIEPSTNNGTNIILNNINNNMPYRSHSVLGLAESNSIQSSDGSEIGHNNTTIATNLNHSSSSSSYYHDRAPMWNGNQNINGIRVPVMPMPRSKSFHQILRPTHNGHILANNGTIRGVNNTHNHHPQQPQQQQQAQTQQQQQKPNVAMFRKQKNVYHHNNVPIVNENHHQSSINVKPNGIKSQFQLKRIKNATNELESILHNRLCQSEINLHQSLSSSSSSSSPSSSSKCSSPNELYDCVDHHRQHQHNQTTNIAIKSTTIANNNNNNQQLIANTKVSNCPISVISTTNGHMSSGSVASKIQRVKQNRIQPTINVVANHQQLSSSSQELDHSGSNSAISMAEKINCKIKRSMSNFDESVYFKNRCSEYQPTTMQPIDSPWKLQRPQPSSINHGKGSNNKNNDNNKHTNQADWYSQYLSFEFLNDRIKSRIQQEIEANIRNNNNSNRWSRLFIMDETSTPITDELSSTGNLNSCSSSSSSSTTTKHDGGNQTSTKIVLNNLDRKQSCSEANLSYSNESSKLITNEKMNGSKPAPSSNGLVKRKSFKKLIEQYFVNNGNHGTDSCYDSDHDSSIRSTLSNYFGSGYRTNGIGQQMSGALASFDQNFILKRSTPNAGLSEHEQRFNQSNLKEYFDNDQSIYERTLRKNRFNNNTNGNTNGNLSNSQTIDKSNQFQQLNKNQSKYRYNSNRTSMSTIDRQLEMFENILNQAMEEQPIDQDNLMLPNNGITNVRSNLNLESISNNQFSMNTMMMVKCNGSIDDNKLRDQLMPNTNQMMIRRKKKKQNHNKKKIKEMKNDQWTPLNDLSTDDDDDEDLEDDEISLDNNNIDKTMVKRNPMPSTYVDSIVDVDIEDFIDGHQYQPPMSTNTNVETINEIFESKPKSIVRQQSNRPSLISTNNGRRVSTKRPAPQPPKRCLPTISMSSPIDESSSTSTSFSKVIDNQNQHDRSTTSSPPAPPLLSGPCFTLSNQLKTLLHNSNRLKTQNYFFY